MIELASRGITTVLTAEMTAAATSTRPTTPDRDAQRQLHARMLSDDGRDRSQIGRAGFDRLIAASSSVELAVQADRQRHEDDQQADDPQDRLDDQPFERVDGQLRQRIDDADVADRQVPGQVAPDRDGVVLGDGLQPADAMPDTGRTPS